MNNAKLLLAKKKELLEECRRRKKERESKKAESNGFKSYNKLLDLSSSIENGGQKSTGDISKDLENLSVDEILEKCGITDFNLSPISSSTLTPSSSTISFSSSNHSIYTTNSVQNHRLKDSEFLAKKFEKLHLKAEINADYKLNILPNESIKYDKESQTDYSVFSGGARNHLKSGDTTTDDEEYETKNSNSRSCQTKKTKLQELKPLEFFEEVLVYDTFQWEDEFNHNHHNAHSDDHKKQSIDEELTDKILSGHEKVANFSDKHSDVFDDEDIEAIEQNLKAQSTSPNFSFLNAGDELFKFLSEKRPIVENALRQNEKNIFVDYTASNDNEQMKLDEENRCAVKFKKRFQTPEKFNNSIVTCLDWSHHHHELLLASYHNMPENYEDFELEATVALWNVKSDQKLPQQLFSNTSLITSCIFSSFQPNIIIAGAFSGQICMWDIRSNKRSPVQRSLLSASSHVNPVYCIRVMDVSHNLVSISNDGRVCYWSLENLNKPYDSQELIIKHATNRNVYASCIDFQTAKNEQQRLAIVGTEDGLAHSLNASNQISVDKTFEGHFGPITSVSCFCSQLSDSNSERIKDNEGLNSLSQLFLTSSFDSTVKLWHTNESTRPLYTFESNCTDYIYDASWSPIHPSLFSCVDGSGRLSLWNLNKSLEAPIISIDVDKRRALNKLKWSPNKGSNIAVGDDHGEISLYELTDELAHPNEDEFESLIKNVSSISKLNLEIDSFNKGDYLNSLNMDVYR